MRARCHHSGVSESEAFREIQRQSMDRRKSMREISEAIILATGDEAPQYVDALARQIRFAEAIVQGLGYQGEHLRLISAGDVAELEIGVWALSQALAVRLPATFHWSADKRTTLPLAIDHLLAHAPVPATEIALPSGAPFGTIEVNREIVAGICMMVGAALWFFLGLAAGIIYFYPPILFVLGIAAIFRGYSGGD